MNKSRWDKYQLVEERHQGEKRMIIDDFEDYFHVKKEQFKNQVCLEIGCGVTGSIHYINDTKLNIGLDPLCSSCRDLYFRENTNNTPHITAIGEYLPVKNNVVDSIFIYGALDHCLSPNEVLKETNRVLVKGGRVYIRVYVFSKIPRFIREKLSLIDIHPHHLSQKEIIKMSEGAGLKVEWVYPKKVPFIHAWTRFTTGTLKTGIKYIGATVLGIEDLAVILVKD